MFTLIKFVLHEGSNKRGKIRGILQKLHVFPKLKINFDYGWYTDLDLMDLIYIAVIYTDVKPVTGCKDVPVYSLGSL